jgi:hypothetical protein
MLTNSLGKPAVIWDYSAIFGSEFFNQFFVYSSDRIAAHLKKPTVVKPTVVKSTRWVLGFPIRAHGFRGPSREFRNTVLVIQIFSNSF